LRLRPALRALVETHDHVLARILQVEGVGVPLAPVADDRDLLSLDEGKVGVLVVVDPGRHGSSFLDGPQSTNPETRGSRLGSSSPRRREAPSGGSPSRSSARRRVVLDARAMATFPVRTSSWIPMGRSSSMMASSFDSSPVTSSVSVIGVTSM